MRKINSMIIFIIILVVGMLLTYFVIVSFTPSFGADLSTKQKNLFKKYENFAQGKFNNRKAVPEKITFSRFIELGYKYLTTKVVNGTPNKPPEVMAIDSFALVNNDRTQLFWMGHSTFLLQHLGKTILFDPMFGEVPAPFDFLGNKRFNLKLPIKAEDLPKIDYVIFSHDHYDHLDYKSILQIKGKVERFLVPLGVGNHLEKWGVKKDKITELNWWENIRYDNLNFICTPAQHFSGRKFSNSQETLWASWVVQFNEASIYFSGDSGYDTHFKSIGDKYGPFNLSLLECGQYNDLWPDIHMFPEETVQAGIDLRSEKIIPIHWGAFKLAMHPWNDPVKRVLIEGKKRGINIEIPKIGERIVLDTLNLFEERWWE